MGARGLAALLVACTLVGCRPPQTGPRKQGNLKTGLCPLSVAEASLDASTLVFDVEFDNASPATVSIQGVDYELWLAGKLWAKGEVGQDSTVTPRSKTALPVQVVVPFATLRKAIPSLAEDPQIEYLLRATVRIPTRGGDVVRVPLRGQGLVTFPAAPGLELVRLAIETIEPTKARVRLVLRVTNEQAFRATVREVRCGVHLGGKRVGDVDLTPNAALAPHKSVELSVPLDLDFGRLGADLHAAIASGKVDVGLAGTLRVLTVYGEPALSVRKAGTVPVTR